MSRPKESFDDLRAFEFRDPEEVLDADTMYTVYEIARLLQGLEPDRELDAGTEDILLDWAIPWMLDHEDGLCFAEPDDEDSPGFYGLREDRRPGEGDRSGEDAQSGDAATNG